MLVDNGMQVSPQANCQKYEIEAEVTVQINLLTDNTLAEDARQRILKLMPPHTDINLTKLEIREADPSEWDFTDFSGNTFKHP